jgi:hypothetical protein
VSVSGVDGFAMNLAHFRLDSQSVVCAGGAAIGHSACCQDTGGYRYQLLHGFSSFIEMRIVNNMGQEKTKEWERQVCHRRYQ